MPTAPAPAGYTIILNAAEWFRLRKARGLDADVTIAKRMHVTPHTVSRVQTGYHKPSPAFIAGALYVLDDPADRVPFGRLFKITAR